MARIEGHSKASWGNATRAFGVVAGIAAIVAGALTLHGALAHHSPFSQMSGIYNKPLHTFLVSGGMIAGGATITAAALFALKGKKKELNIEDQIAEAQKSREEATADYDKETQWVAYYQEKLTQTTHGTPEADVVLNQLTQALSRQENAQKKAKAAFSAEKELQQTAVALAMLYGKDASYNAAS